MPFIETARCDGRCCRDFVIPAVHAVGGFEAWKAMVADPDALRRFADAEYIVDMLVIKDGKVEVCPLSGNKLDEPQEHFGCRHWDEATGDCTAYAARPCMCEDWPYDDNGSRRRVCYGRLYPANPVGGRRRRTQGGAGL